MDSSNEIYTFEIVEEILFRVRKIRVWERGCESVEVEGRFHGGRSLVVVKVEKIVGPPSPIGSTMGQFLSSNSIRRLLFADKV